MSEQTPQATTEHAGQQSAEEATDRLPTLEELNEQREALGARITEHFERLRGQ